MKLKLSEAILLGDGLKKAMHYVYLDVDSDGGACGCALGGALLATGLTVNEWLNGAKDTRFGEVAETIKSRWPWISWEQVNRIGIMYSLSQRKDFPLYTLEQIVDYVKSIEPAEEIAEYICDETTEELWTDSKTTMERDHSIRGI